MKEDNPLELFTKDMETFRENWSRYTENSNGLKISSKKILLFLQKLPDPLGNHIFNLYRLQNFRNR